MLVLYDDWLHINLVYVDLRYLLRRHTGRPDSLLMLDTNNWHLAVLKAAIDTSVSSSGANGVESFLHDSLLVPLKFHWLLSRFKLLGELRLILILNLFKSLPRNPHV